MSAPIAPSPATSFSTLHSRTRISVSARGPASAIEPWTRGAANGNSSVGVSAGLRTVVWPPADSECSEPTHSTSASTSE